VADKTIWWTILESNFGKIPCVRGVEAAIYWLWPGEGRVLAAALVKNLAAKHKAKLSSWLLDSRRLNRVNQGRSEAHFLLALAKFLVAKLKAKPNDKN
jgi:hypothetical protein